MGAPRVLIVDDNPAIRSSLAAVLTDEGFLPIEASDGRMALQILEGMRGELGTLPCAILLDLMMPGMDGWEFRRQQLGHAALAGVPVIVMAAGGNSTKQVDTNVSGFLAKPFRIDDLMDCLRELPGQRLP